jgi:hypothetical protein
MKILTVVVLRRKPNEEVTLERGLGGPQRRSGRYGKEKNVELPEIEPELFSLYPVAIPAELSRLL